MSITVYNKLVRDKIPKIIIADGHTPVTRVLTEDDEYREALIAKLGEEAEELRTATESGRIGELADLQEVLNSLARSYGYSPPEVVYAAAKKRLARGGFDGRIYLEHTTAEQQ
jgi:predicted house-cleaning noncanonical NTP pyrophosphatase (MazG superfamily)